MALIDALLDKITNESLRKALREQVDHLLGKQSFGLVFQQHKPETVVGCVKNFGQFLGLLIKQPALLGGGR